MGHARPPQRIKLVSGAPLLLASAMLLCSGCAAMFKLGPSPTAHPETLAIGGLEASVIQDPETLVVLTGWKTVHQELIFNVFVLNKGAQRKSVWLEDIELRFVDKKGVQSSEKVEEPRAYRHRIEDQQVLADILAFFSGGLIHTHPEWAAGGGHRHSRYGYHQHPELVWQSGETTLDGLERAGYLDQGQDTGDDYLARYRSASDRLLSSVTLGPGRSTEGLVVTRFSPADEYELDLVVGGKHYVFKFRPLPSP
jgi:hypothetical protein